MVSRPLGHLRSGLESWRVQACILVVVGLLANAGRFLADSISVSSAVQDRAVDGLQIVTCAFAIFCCVFAALKRSGVARSFWFLFAGALACQLCADIGWATVHLFGISVHAGAIFPSLFYRLYAAPMAIALFLSDEDRGTRVQSFLDGCIAIGLVSLTMYQVQMAEMSAHDSRIWRAISLTTSVNTVLILMAVGRYLVCTPGPLRSLFQRQIIYLSAYWSVAVLTSVADAYFPRLSSYADLLWSATYLMAAALAATWRPPAADSAVRRRRISRRASLLCFNLTLVAMVLASAMLGLRLMDTTRVVGLIGVAIVLFSFAIRSALMQDAQERTLAELEESRAQLRRQALYDQLTGLPNRRLLGDRLDQALAAAKRDGTAVALLYLDLDGFKPVNDRFGHAAGDAVLVEIAHRLRSRVRETDTVARVGGDEFTLVMSRVAERVDAEMLARLILDSVNEPMAMGDQALTMTGSIGIALFPEDATDGDALMEQADRSMYAAKRRGKNGIRMVGAEIDAGEVSDLDGACAVLSTGA